MSSRICFVYQYAYPESVGGGEKRLFEVASRLDTTVDWYAQYTSLCSQTAGNINFISLSHSKCKKRGFMETLDWFLCMFKIPILQYDLIHTGQMPFFHILSLQLRCYIYRKLKGCRVLLSIDWWEYWGPHWNKYRFPINKIGKIVENLILMHADNIVVISGKTKNDITGLTNAKLNLIHNGVNLENISQADIGEGSDFVYFGRLVQHKRIDRSIVVFNELVKLDPKLSFVILGDGPEMNNLKKLVSDLGLDKNVRFYGFIKNDQDVYSIIKASKCMLFFAEQEGGGSIALFEANACGVPVAHSYAPNGIDKELLTLENSFYFDYFDASKIAQILHTYVDNTGKESLSYSCVRFVNDKDWSNIAMEYKKYFSALLETLKCV